MRDLMSFRSKRGRFKSQRRERITSRVLALCEAKQDPAGHSDIWRPKCGSHSDAPFRHRWRFCSQCKQLSSGRATGGFPSPVKLLFTFLLHFRSSHWVADRRDSCFHTPTLSSLRPRSHLNLPRRILSLALILLQKRIAFSKDT